MGSRKYQLKKRALSQEETRQKIVSAAVYLHELKGPLATTISDIAAQAGVERLTVYRHFADEVSLLAACTTHYLTHYPPPDPGKWEQVKEPELCLRAALNEIYAYYRQTEGMMVVTYRDVDSSPSLKQVLTPFFEYWRGIRDRLAEKYPGNDEARALIRAAAGHAIHFLTWRSLVREQGLDDEKAVEVMVATVQAASSMG